jgi:hydrogenase-4 component B
MTDPILPLLAGVVAALFALGLLAAIAPARAMRIVPLASAWLCAFAAVLVLIGLLAGGQAQVLDIPLGLPGTAMRLALDGLSGFFLLLLFATATAASLYAHEPHGTEDRRALPFFPVLIGAMALALIAGDGFALVFGFALMSLASWATMLAPHEEVESRDAGLLYLGMAVFAAACLIPALALLAPDGAVVSGLRFSAIRAAMPPEGWRATLVLALVLLGAGSQAGLAPLHVWLPLAHPAAPSHVSALMSGAMTKVALYVIVRVLFDLCGPAQPLWWGVPLILMGAASAVLGGLRANTEADIKAVLAASTVGNVGLIAIGIGVALIARAADLPALAALALGGAMLHAANHGVFKTLLFLCAGAAQHGGGSRALARLGGLIHRMPVTTACVLVGSVGLATLPPGAGFAGVWMLLQSVLAGPRIGGLALQILLAVTAALMAMAAALAAAAAVRLVGVAFLGRPRTPRVAAAEEAGPMARRAMIGLAVACCLLGLLPGPVLRLAGPALGVLAGGSIADRAGTLVVAPGSGLPGYAAPAIAVILGLALAATLLALRRFTRPGGHRRGPAWACGFAAAPPWLPFGDPLTQYGGASFAQPLRRALGFSVAPRDPAAAYVFAPLNRLHGVIANLADAMQPLTIRRALGVMFTTLVLFLAVIALLEAL